MTATRSSLLLLADGRLPAGGHAHSGGMEEAVAAKRVRDLSDLAEFLAGRLATAGRVDAALAAWAGSDDPLVVNAEAVARCPSPRLRAASRSQARALLRAGAKIWPLAVTGEVITRCGPAPMWPVALGVVARGIGVGSLDAATVAAYSSVSGPAWAATRLLGLDPFAVARCLADLSEAIDGEGAAGAAWVDAGCDISLLPAGGGPLSDIGAEHHGTWEVRLFAS